MELDTDAGWKRATAGLKCVRSLCTTGQQGQEAGAGNENGASNWNLVFFFTMSASV